MSDILNAARALVLGAPTGARARTGDIGYGDEPLAWYEYEWDGSHHCIGCGSGSWHDDMRGMDHHYTEDRAPYILMADGFYHVPDCPAMMLDAAVKACPVDERTHAERMRDAESDMCGDDEL